MSNDEQEEQQWLLRLYAREWDMITEALRGFYLMRCKNPRSGANPFALLDEMNDDRANPELAPKKNWRPFCFGENYQGVGEDTCIACPWILECQKKSMEIREKTEAYRKEHGGESYVVESRADDIESKVCPFLAQGPMVSGEVLMSFKVEGNRDREGNIRLPERYETFLWVERLPKCVGPKCAAHYFGQCLRMRQVPL